tara:strand:+ start:302 stop:643 length:342 start_codon:yes stop_codon:yes gene_type:complete
MTDVGLILTYIMIGGATLACIASPILQIKNDPEKIKKLAGPLISLILIISIAMLISSNEVLPEYTNTDGNLISANMSRFVGGCLITFYLLSAITILSVLYSEFLYKFFQNGKK